MTFLFPCILISKIKSGENNCQDVLHLQNCVQTKCSSMFYKAPVILKIYLLFFLAANFRDFPGDSGRNLLSQLLNKKTGYFY